MYARAWFEDRLFVTVCDSFYRRYFERFMKQSYIVFCHASLPSDVHICTPQNSNARITKSITAHSVHGSTTPMIAILIFSTCNMWGRTQPPRNHRRHSETTNTISDQPPNPPIIHDRKTFPIHHPPVHHRKISTANPTSSIHPSRPQHVELLSPRRRTCRSVQLVSDSRQSKPYPSREMTCRSLPAFWDSDV